jgi:hypothetical protein
MTFYTKDRRTMGLWSHKISFLWWSIMQVKQSKTNSSLRGQKTLLWECGSPIHSSCSLPTTQRDNILLPQPRDFTLIILQKFNRSRAL